MSAFIRHNHGTSTSLPCSPRPGSQSDHGTGSVGPDRMWIRLWTAVSRASVVHWLAVDTVPQMRLELVLRDVDILGGRRIRGTETGVAIVLCAPVLTWDDCWMRLAIHVGMHADLRSSPASARMQIKERSSNALCKLSLGEIPGVSPRSHHGRTVSSQGSCSP